MGGDFLTLSCHPLQIYFAPLASLMVHPLTRPLTNIKPTHRFLIDPILRLPLHINPLASQPIPHLPFPHFETLSVSYYFDPPLMSTPTTAPAASMPHYDNEDSIPVFIRMLAEEPGSGSINLYRRQEKESLWKARGSSSAFFRTLSSEQQLLRARHAWMKITLLRRFRSLYDTDVLGCRTMPEGDELVRVFARYTPLVISTPPTRVVLARATTTPLPPSEAESTPSEELPRASPPPRTPLSPAARAARRKAIQRALDEPITVVLTPGSPSPTPLPTLPRHEATDFLASVFEQLRDHPRQPTPPAVKEEPEESEELEYQDAVMDVDFGNDEEHQPRQDTPEGSWPAPDSPFMPPSPSPPPTFQSPAPDVPTSFHPPPPNWLLEILKILRRNPDSVAEVNRRENRADRYANPLRNRRLVEDDTLDSDFHFILTQEAACTRLEVAAHQLGDEGISQDIRRYYDLHACIEPLKAFQFHLNDLITSHVVQHRAVANRLVNADADEKLLPHYAYASLGAVDSPEPPSPTTSQESRLRGGCSGSEENLQPHCSSCSARGHWVEDCPLPLLPCFLHRFPLADVPVHIQVLRQTNAQCGNYPSGHLALRCARVTAPYPPAVSIRECTRKHFSMCTRRCS